MFRLSPQEAEVRRRETLGRRVIVILQENDGPVLPWRAPKLDMGEAAKLHGGERHSFSCASLANDNGNLRIGQKVILECWGSSASTCDGEEFDFTAVLEFNLPRNKRILCELVESDSLQAISHAVPARVLSAVSCAIGGATCREVLNSGRRLQDQCFERLSAELRADPDNGGYGLEVHRLSWTPEHREQLDHLLDIIRKIVERRRIETNGHAAAEIPSSQERRLIPFRAKAGAQMQETFSK